MHIDRKFHSIILSLIINNFESVKSKCITLFLGLITQANKKLMSIHKILKKYCTRRDIWKHPLVTIYFTVRINISRKKDLILIINCKKGSLNRKLNVCFFMIFNLYKKYFSL